MADDRAGIPGPGRGIAGNMCRRALLPAIMVAMVVGLWWTGHHSATVAFLDRVQRAVAGMGAWGGVCYPLLMAACNLLLMPGGILSLGSGLFFGLWWGFLLVWFGTLLGAAIAFQLSRTLGRRWIQPWISGRKRWVALDAAIAREGWKIVVLSQVHPLFPTSLLHYVYGVTRMRFWPCMFWIAVGRAPGLFLYTYIGTLAQLGIRLAQGETDPGMGEYIAWFGGLGFTVVITILLGQVAIRVMRSVDAPD